MAAGAAALSDKTLRIDVEEVLNRMMNLVGELVLTRNQMLQSGVEATNFLLSLARRLDSVTLLTMRETVMQARMQQVGNPVREVSEDGA